MKTNIKLILSIVTCAMLFTACGMKKSQDNHESKVHAAEKHSENTVSFTPMQRKTIGLKLGPIQKRNMTGTIEVSGELALAPQYEADVSAMVGANVTKINVIAGEKVEKGQVIALLKHPSLIQMQVDLQESNSRLAYLKQDYERQKNLNQKGVGSGKDLQHAKSVYFSTKAKVKGLKAKLRMFNLDVEAILEGKIFSSIPVKAPIGGFIKEINVRMGQYVTQGDILFEVVDNSQIHADMLVFEEDIGKVQEGQKVYFTVSNRSGKQYTATIYSVGKTFKENPKAVKIHANIKSDTAQLIPGLYVQGRIAVSDQTSLVLPGSAIVRGANEFYIFVKVGETNHEESKAKQYTSGKSWIFKKVPVSTGLKDNGWVTVNLFNSLPDSALIAYTGAYKLNAAMGAAEREGHSH